MCASGAQCIPEVYLCDGDVAYGNAQWGPDCTDGSDEVWQWCAHPDRTEVEIPAGLHHYHNNLVQQCSSGESVFSCDSTGCVASGCQSCLHCDDSAEDCLLQPFACIGAGCVWDTDECRAATSSDQELSAECQGLQLAASCAAESEFCSEACYDSLHAVPAACLGATGEFNSLGASSAWINQVETLKGGKCATRGCTGPGKTQLRVQLFDSFGDGWNMEPDCTDPENGCNVYTISTVPNAPSPSPLTTVTGTLEYSANLEASAGELQMCVDSTSTKCVQIHVGAEGTFPEEISWSVKDAATGATLTPRSRMGANSFYRHDAIDDDVDDCTDVPMPERRFRCYNGEMIPWSEVCDNSPDCRNGEDEAPTLAGFCPHKTTCNVLNPEMIGNGWCDDAADPETNTVGCGFDGGDCQCLRDFANIKADCSFPMVGTGASAVRGDAPPTGRCVDFGTCAQGRQFTTNGVTTVVPRFSDFTNDCFYIHEPAVYRALTEFSFTCSPTFTCSNGDQILESNKCNGWKDCLDGSDEGFTMCAGQYQYGVVERSFRCIDGTLKDQALECNGVCNCGNTAHGMCEDEHPVRGDTTCAAQVCGRRATSVLEACGGVWPASISADGVQKATCGTMCATELVALFTDASCDQHLPAGLTAAGAADAVRLCQHVIDHRAQPVFLCRDSTQTTIPIGQSQVCDEVDDCGGAEDEARHTPKCPYIVQAEAEAAGVEAQIDDCVGIPRDPALLQNGVCDKIDGVEIFNCAGLGSGLDYDAGDCKVEAVIEMETRVAAPLTPAQFAQALAAASDTIDPEMVEISSYTETTAATISLGGLTPAMLDPDTPAGAAAAEQIIAGLCTLLNQPEPCSVTLTGQDKGRRRLGMPVDRLYNTSVHGNSSSFIAPEYAQRRRTQASTTDVGYTVTSTEPLSSTMQSDSYGSDAADAINSGGNILPVIDPSTVVSDVGDVETDIDFVITVDSSSLDTGSGVQSSADVSAALGTELTTTLEDSSTMRSALVAAGADICDSCRMSTTTGAVHTSSVQTQETGSGPPPAPPPPPVTVRCTGNADSSEDFDCGSQNLKDGASSIVGNDADTCCMDSSTDGLTDEQKVVAAAAGGLLIILLLCCCCIVIILLVCLYKRQGAAAAAVKQVDADIEVQQAHAVVPAGLEQWDTNQDGVLDAAELRAMAEASSSKLPPISPSVAVQPADDATPLLVAHLTEHGVKGNQEEYIRALVDDGFDTPELFDSLSLEELEKNYGFKRGHLRAVEAHRRATQVTQGP